MKKFIPILLSVLALVAASLACQMFEPDVSLENLRMAHDENGDEITSTFTNTDAFYAVVDLKDAPQDTVVKAVWTAVEVDDSDPDYELEQHTLDVTEETFSGSIYFKLSNDDLWPPGLYRVDMYLNETLAQSLEFNVE